VLLIGQENNTFVHDPTLSGEEVTISDQRHPDHLPHERVQGDMKEDNKDDSHLIKR
jgi:hypothetical protein